MRTTTVILVIIIAFVACYAWGVVRTGDERADGPLTYFKTAEVGVVCIRGIWVDNFTPGMTKYP